MTENEKKPAPALHKQEKAKPDAASHAGEARGLRTQAETVSAAIARRIRQRRYTL